MRGCWTQKGARPTLHQGSLTIYETTTLILASGGARTAHSLLRRLGLNHLESVNHDSDHHANHSENDGPLDQLFLQRLLSKRLVIHLIEHVPVPLSANNTVGSLRDVWIV